MAEAAVKEKGVSVALACRTFGISEAGYRYRPKLGDENAEIADWLLRLTATHRLGLWPGLSVSEEHQGLCLEPQAGLPHLPRA
jgi:hypothetical protein